MQFSNSLPVFSFLGIEWWIEEGSPWRLGANLEKPVMPESIARMNERIPPEAAILIYFTHVPAITEKRVTVGLGTPASLLALSLPPGWRQFTKWGGSPYQECTYP
jgi:hypothetical protein